MSITSKINDSLSGRALLYTAGNFALNFLSVISAPIFVRLMSTAEYGTAAIFFTWVLLLSNVVGLRVDGTIQNARSTYGSDKLAGYCSSTLFLSIGGLLLMLVVSFVLIRPLSSVSGLAPAFWMLAVVTSFGIACSNARMLYCTAEKKATGNMLISLLLAALQVAVSLVFLLFFLDTGFNGDGFAARVVGYAIPSIGVGLGIVLFFFLKGKTFVDFKYWKFCLTLSIPLIFNGIAYLLINQSGRLIVNELMGASMAGIYSFAYSAGLPASVLASAMGSAWAPEYYDYLDKGDVSGMKKHAQLFMRNMTLVFCGVMLVVPEVLMVLGTPEYYEGIPMLPLIVLAYYFQYLFTWPVNCKFYHRKTKSIATSTAIAAVANVVLCFLGVVYFGIIGAAAASLAAFFILFLLHHFTAKKEVDSYDFSFGWYMKGLLPVLAVTIISYVFIDSFVVRWAVAAVFGILFFMSVKKNKSLM